MQGIDLTALEELDERFSRIIREFPEKRRALHVRLAALTEEELDKNIDASGLKDNEGKIKRWQIKHVGSGGGYAAVRPAGGKEGGDTGANSAGAISNYLERGHAVRRPNASSNDGKKRKMRSRAKKTYVDGYHFYQKTLATLAGKVIDCADSFVDELIDKWDE